MEKILLVFVPVLLLVSCGTLKRESTLKEQMKDHSGIWTMFDSVAMRSFVGLEPEPKGPYCMDFQPMRQRALIRFLDHDKLYTIKVLPRGGKHYFFGWGKFVRDFMVASDRGPHEATFSDDTSLAGFLYIASDGRQANYHTIMQCVDDQQKGHWTTEYWTKNFNEHGNTPWQRKAAAKANKIKPSLSVKRTDKKK